MNQEGLARAFLKEVLSHLVEEVVRHFSYKDQSFFIDHSDVLSDLLRITGDEERATYFSEILRKDTISSSFFGTQDLLFWCEVAPQKCMKFSIRELEKGDNGIFRTSLKLQLANLSLIRDVNLIAHKLLAKGR